MYNDKNNVHTEIKQATALPVRISLEDTIICKDCRNFTITLLKM